GVCDGPDGERDLASPAVSNEAGRNFGSDEHQPEGGLEDGHFGEGKAPEVRQIEHPGGHPELEVHQEAKQVELPDIRLVRRIAVENVTEGHSRERTAAPRCSTSGRGTGRRAPRELSRSGVPAGRIPWPRTRAPQRGGAATGWCHGAGRDRWPAAGVWSLAKVSRRFRARWSPRPEVPRVCP